MLRVIVVCAGCTSEQAKNVGTSPLANKTPSPTVDMCAILCLWYVDGPETAVLQLCNYVRYHDCRRVAD